MFQSIAQLCGGIGLFLIGMTLMTDNLKNIASDTLRQWLTKFTSTPFKAMLSGMGLTLLVQSSTATIVTTIGFVSAGALNFAQAIGVVIGANIGTTSTGWIVALLGVKFSLAMFALPLIGLGAIMRLLLKGKAALFGFVIAGFGLLFFGIDILQTAMSDFSQNIDLSFLGYRNLWSKLLLVLIGIILAVILQSSSATVTATLAAVATGTIDLSQAMYLVIGQNVGAVSITVLSVIGASVEVKRTVAVNVIFNIVSAIAAFFVLVPLFIWGYQYTWMGSLDAVIVVAAFHTAFSVFGALLMMPNLTKIECHIVKVLPDTSPSVLKYLSDASLEHSTTALQAAERVIYITLFNIFSIFNHAIRDDLLPNHLKLRQIDDVIQHLNIFLEKIIVPEKQFDKLRYLTLLRVTVYLRVLRSDLETIKNIRLIRTQPIMYQLALDYSNILENHIHDINTFGSRENISDLRTELGHLKRWTSVHRVETRNHLQEYAVKQQLSAAKNLELLSCQRWIERVIAHTYKFSNVLFESLTEIYQSEDPTVIEALYHDKL